MESLRIPTGVLWHEPEHVYKGYTLYSPVCNKETYLVDMDGYIAHEWKHEYLAGRYVQLLENGNLLRGGIMPKHTFMGGEGGIVQEIDWDGKVVWEYVHHTPTSCQHHSYWRMKNGNTLVLCWRNHTCEACLAKGRTPENMVKDGIVVRDILHTGHYVSYFVEVNPAGETVWEWDYWDHLGANDYHKFDFNYVQTHKATWPDWDHCNNITYNEKTDQILTTSRALGEFYIIDRKSGKLVYRWGNPGTYGGGRRPGFADDGDQQLFGPHNPTWVAPDRVLVFDNGYLRPMGSRSRVLEVNITTGKIVWEWMTPSHNSFSSGSQSNVQRLPNGNTLVVSCESGHIFELTPGGSVTYGATFTDAPPTYTVDEPEGLTPSRAVWEYISPVTPQGPKPLLIHGTETCYSDWTNAMHRAYRYGPDYPGLAGKPLERRPFMPDYPQGPAALWQKMVADYY